MRKIQKGLIGAMVIVLLLCGCGKKPKDVDVNNLMDDISSKIELREMLRLSATDVEKMYGIEKDQMEQFAAKTSLTGERPDEFVIVKAKDRIAAGMINQKLQARYEAKKNQSEKYDQEEADTIKNSGGVSTLGDYVVLVVHKDYEKVLNMIKMAIDG